MRPDSEGRPNSLRKINELDSVRTIALTRLAAEDPAVHKLTAEVQNLLKPRSAYRDPALMQRVLAMMAEA